MIVTFQGLELRSTTVRRGGTDGFVIAPDGWDGWDTPAGVRRDSATRGTDGSFAARAYRTDRLVTVKGHALADTPGHLEAMHEQFAALDAGYHRIAVDSGRHVRWAVGALQSSDFRAFSDLGDDATEAAFELEIWCPDPWKFGDAHHQRLSDGLELVNRGPAAAWPTIRVEGPVSQPFTVTIGQRSYRFAKTLTTGQWIEAQTRTGLVTTNSVPGGRLFNEVTGLVPFLPHGASIVQVAGVDPARVSFTWSDTYY